MTADANRPENDLTGGDIDRSGSATGEADAEKLAEGVDEPVLESQDFTGGGGTGASRPGPIRPGGGSTGSNAIDEGKTDAGGAPGGGMAGSTGG